jgi:hypothetical protein
MVSAKPIERKLPVSDLIPPHYLTQLVNAIFAELGPDEARYIRETIAVVLELSEGRKRAATEGRDVA